MLENILATVPVPFSTSLSIFSSFVFFVTPRLPLGDTFWLPTILVWSVAVGMTRAYSLYLCLSSHTVILN